MDLDFILFVHNILIERDIQSKENMSLLLTSQITIKIVALLSVVYMTHF